MADNYSLAEVLKTVGTLRSQNMQNRLSDMKIRDYENKLKRQEGRRSVYAGQYQPPTPATQETATAPQLPAVSGIEQPQATMTYDIPAKPGGIDYPGAAQELYRMGDIEGAQAAEQTYATQQSKSLEMEKMQGEILKQSRAASKEEQAAIIANLEVRGRILEDVTDEATYMTNMEAGKRAGLIDSYGAYNPEEVALAQNFFKTTVEALNIRKQEELERAAKAKEKAGKKPKKLSASAQRESKEIDYSRRAVSSFLTGKDLKDKKYDIQNMLNPGSRHYNKTFADHWARSRKIKQGEGGDPEHAAFVRKWEGGGRAPVAQPTQRRAKEGDIVNNPAGERLIWKGGKWQKLTR